MQQTADRRGEVDGFYRPVDDRLLANCRTESHHPCGASRRAPGAMVLKTVAPAVGISIPAKIRQDEETGAVFVLRVGLNLRPDFRAQPVGAADAVQIKRVCAGMRNVDVMERQEEKRRCELTHDMTGEEY